MGIVLLLGILTGALLLCACWQAIGLRRDARRHPPPGRLVSIGTHRLHLYTAGEGRPVVVMDAGLAHSSPVWGLVAPNVAAFTPVCTYDRAGYAWSAPGPLPRTSRQVVEELRALLAHAQIPGPYLLVGHSFGGLNMTLFASLYPHEVVGLVLVDALPASIQTENAQTLAEFISWNRFRYRTLAALVRLGLLRLYCWLKGSKATVGYSASLPAAQRPAILSGFLRGTYSAAAAESAALNTSIAQAQTVHLARALPLRVLTHGHPDMFTSQMRPADAAQAEHIWQRMQAALARSSDYGRLVVAEESGHKIHLDQPELVIAAIRDLVEEVRLAANTPNAAPATRQTPTE